jgi:hypothetical protein
MKTFVMNNKDSKSSITFEGDTLVLILETHEGKKYEHRSPQALSFIWDLVKQALLEYEDYPKSEEYPECPGIPYRIAEVKKIYEKRGA